MITAINNQLVADFKAYANSFKRGFLKDWKARGILGELKDFDHFFFDNEVHFLDWLCNCLEMEGFRKADIELIMDWLYERKDQL